MNFPTFGAPFSGIHQFAAKIGSNEGAFSSGGNSGAAGNGANGALPGAAGAGGGVPGAGTNHGGQQQDLNRYHGASNGNHFNQITTSSKMVQHSFRFSFFFLS